MAKNILITTGIHGNERSPIILGHILKGKGFENEYESVARIENSLNKSGIKACEREVVDSQNNDNKDLNRSFIIDEPTKNVSELNDYIENIVSENSIDMIIDIHSSPDCGEFFLIDQDDYANGFVEFCERANIPYLVRYNKANTLKKYFNFMKGIPTFTMEINGMEKVDMDSVDNAKNILKNLLEYQISNPIENFFRSEEPKYSPCEHLHFYKEGLFVRKVDYNDFMEPNIDIGNLIDIETGEEDNITYERDYYARPLVGIGDSYITPSVPFMLIQPYNPKALEG